MLPFQHTGLQICRLGVEGYGIQNMYMFIPLLIKLFLKKFISDTIWLFYSIVQMSKGVKRIIFFIRNFSFLIQVQYTVSILDNFFELGKHYLPPEQM